ncbi:hypothetical protein HW555_003017 [Spodoptera exigua]|uniref:Uncharacterized protein n=1 Tax=Spodoptera exigua TaxID=7107 RepID=A0A835GMP6_SPOEX|nr:hypothetical protein HW555_003017 [Spodoptera exigua]
MYMLEDCASSGTMRYESTQTFGKSTNIKNDIRIKSIFDIALSSVWTRRDIICHVAISLCSVINSQRHLLYQGDGTYLKLMTSLRITFDSSIIDQNSSMSADDASENGVGTVTGSTGNGAAVLFKPTIAAPSTGHLGVEVHELVPLNFPLLHIFAPSGAPWFSL